MGTTIDIGGGLNPHERGYVDPSPSRLRQEKWMSLMTGIWLGFIAGIVVCSLFLGIFLSWFKI